MGKVFELERCSMTVRLWDDRGFIPLAFLNIVDEWKTRWDRRPALGRSCDIGRCDDTNDLGICLLDYK